jgi:hypothetical protein
VCDLARLASVQDTFGPSPAPDMVVIRLGNAFGTRLKETGGGLVFELIESWAFEAVFIPRNRDCYGSEGSMNTG